jgi:hypothetical protein
VDIDARTTRRVIADEQVRAALREIPTDVRLEAAGDGILDAAGRCYVALWTGARA